MTSVRDNTSQTYHNLTTTLRIVLSLTCLKSQVSSKVDRYLLFVSRFLCCFNILLDPNIGVIDTIRPPPPVHFQGSPSNGAVTHKAEPNGVGHGSDPSSDQQPMMFTRKPPAHPALNPEYRYCYRDKFVKPTRAHHCRACGTVSVGIGDQSENNLTYGGMSSVF